MKCPHCNEDLRYKERTGRRCSKCKREFAFEPKTDRLGLHDARFRKAIAKLSADGKLYFTAGQLLHFLSRRKIKNSFSAVRGLLIFLTVAAVFVSIVLFSTPVIYLTAPAAVLFAVLTIIFWRKEGNLNLPISKAEFEQNILPRWSAIYGDLPPRLLSENFATRNSDVSEKARAAALVCANDEILACLAANRIGEKFNLIFINLSQPVAASEKSKIQFVRSQKDLPFLVLHDASIEGCLLKDEFVRLFASGDAAATSAVYDIGLRPNDVMNANFVRLRQNVSADSTQNLRGLDPAEVEWLKSGSRTPLAALTPAQLFNLVANGVKRYAPPHRRQQQQETSAERRAEAVGFMTWLGE
jgi:uncharacterized membrane protein